MTAVIGKGYQVMVATKGGQWQRSRRWWKMSDNSNGVATTTTTEGGNGNVECWAMVIVPWRIMDDNSI